uniref:Cytochrome P450 n=1 Tax=Salix viminalis TaxID=40686 RepID=A0A6N2LHS9_SALVM
MVTLRMGTRTAIFVADRTLAHEALIQSSAVYADRPPAAATRRIISSNQHNISCSFFGPTWRLLRRNLTAEILHPSRLLEEKRKLKEEEMVSLCSEFLDAGTDTTSTALQWIIANLVKYQQIQEKLFVEIKGVVQDGDESIKQEELQKKLYLKALILEGLRRHPPGHFVLPHAVTEDVILGKYVVPKNATINFMVAEMGWDPEVWEDPMVFKPERFLESGGETFDITGNKY